MLQLLVPVAHAFFVPAFRPASPCPAAVMTVAAPAVSEGTITLTPEQVSAFGRPAVRLLTDAADATSAAENADVYSEEEDLALAMACMRMAAKEVEIESLRSRLESFAKPSGTMYCESAPDRSKELQCMSSHTHTHTHTHTHSPP